MSDDKWQDLQQLGHPNSQQLENIKSHLDLVLLAIEAIADITSEDILKAARELNLELIVSDRISLWRLRQSNPHRKSTGGRKKLDVEEARSLVLIICYLAKRERELIRRAVSLLEQITAQNKQPHQTALLGNYLDKFINCYQERIEVPALTSTQSLSQLALKLLIDLLFYSGDRGYRLLWLAIFDSATIKQ